VALPAVGQPPAVISSLDLPAGSYIVTAKLQLAYTVTDVDEGGQSTALCSLAHNGGQLDGASATLNHGNQIGTGGAWSADKTTIALATGFQWGAPFTLEVVCARTGAVPGDSLTAYDAKLVAVQVASPLTFG